jgi:hypothetical protein
VNSSFEGLLDLVGLIAEVINNFSKRRSAAPFQIFKNFDSQVFKYKIMHIVFRRKDGRPVAGADSSNQRVMSLNSSVFQQGYFIFFSASLVEPQSGSLP